MLDLRGAVPAAAPHAAPAARGLVLSESGLETVPARVAKLGRLEMLDLAHNRLAVVPAELAALTRLDVLYLGDNRLLAIPEAVRARCGRCGT